MTMAGTVMAAALARFRGGRFGAVGMVHDAGGALRRRLVHRAYRILLPFRLMPPYAVYQQPAEPLIQM